MIRAFITLQLARANLLWKRIRLWRARHKAARLARKMADAERRLVDIYVNVRRRELKAKGE